MVAMLSDNGEKQFDSIGRLLAPRRNKMNFIENESAQKLRGGYYTPTDLAKFLCEWIADAKPTEVLEPSCGNGAFWDGLTACSGTRRARITAFELDNDEASIAAKRAKELNLKVTIRATDFLGWATAELLAKRQEFDAVVGNPPFVRYQYLPEVFQQRSEQVFKLLGCRFTKHTNAWVPFVLASFAMLKPGGRLAMVVPAEVIHVTHAQSLRTFLGEQCTRLVIVDPEELWFADTLQGAVLLLAQKRRSPRDVAEGLGIVRVRSREFLKRKPSELFAAPEAINGKTVSGKWTRALLPKSVRDMLDELDEHPEVHRFQDIADVDVGIVTGANKYFLVSDDVVRRNKLEKYAAPMFGRSEHCPGIIYDEDQHRRNAALGNPTNFLWFKDGSVAKDKNVQAYIEEGEKERLHTRFKCRVRKPWYSVPSVYATEIGMLKRSHEAPRLILNRLGAYTTDTAYRIRSNVAAERLVACFLNPLTALSAELEGRHYGGGVLELVPSEIEKLTIPLPKKPAKLNLKELDLTVRGKTTSQVLASHGHQVLANIGVPKKSRELIYDAWAKLKNRRHRTSTEADQSDWA